MSNEGGYYNTNGLAGAELRQARGKGRDQASRILALMREYPDACFTAEDALQALRTGTPITSARRALTDLATAGEIEKVPLEERTVRGAMGKPIHSWRLTRPTQPGLFDAVPRSD